MTDADQQWMRLQLTQPQTLYTLGELQTLSGIEKRRVRRYLVGKGVVDEDVDGRRILVDLHSLTTKVPDFWMAIKSRIAGGL